MTRSRWAFDRTLTLARLGLEDLNCFGVFGPLLVGVLGRLGWIIISNTHWNVFVIFSDESLVSCSLACCSCGFSRLLRLVGVGATVAVVVHQCRDLVDYVDVEVAVVGKVGTQIESLLERLCPARSHSGLDLDPLFLSKDNGRV